MKLRGITRNVIVLGFVSFFTDVASEMLYPVIPLFLVSAALGGTPALLGLVDGLAEGISSGLRWIGGALSDRFGRRKPFVFAGYTLSAVSKPLMGAAAYFGGWPVFLVGRCSDRLGKSIRTSARDALIADSTDPEFRGAAFGLHRTMDTCGAILGPLAALVILLVRPNTPLQWLFFIAVAPGLMSSLLVAATVRDIPRPPGEGKPPPIFQSFPAPFWHLIIANAIFSFGNSSDSFLILRSKDIGLTFPQVILAFAVYNTVYAAAALPLGRLSDRIGRKPVVIAGWITYAAVYFGFAVAHAWIAPWLLLGSYGLYQAFSEGVTKAMVSDVVSPRQRAGAIGLFYTVSGVGQLVASVMAGLVWNVKLAGGHVMLAFALGTVFALMAVPVIATVKLAPFDRAGEARAEGNEAIVSAEDREG